MGKVGDPAHAIHQCKPNSDKGKDNTVYCTVYQNVHVLCFKIFWVIEFFEFEVMVDTGDSQDAIRYWSAGIAECISGKGIWSSHHPMAPLNKIGAKPLGSSLKLKQASHQGRGPVRFIIDLFHLSQGGIFNSPVAAASGKTQTLLPSCHWIQQPNTLVFGS